MFHSNLFLHFLRQNLIRCFFRKNLGRFFYGTSNLHIYLILRTNLNGLCYLWHCLVLSKYRVCSEAFRTQIGHISGIATLCFFSLVDGLAVSETTAVTLPSIEQATSLGFGNWRNTFANADFIFCESYSLATISSSRSFVGRHICIITLECVLHIHTGHIIIRSELVSRLTFPAIKLRFSLSDQLESYNMKFFQLEDIPLYTSKAEEEFSDSKAVRKKLISSIKVR